MIYYGKNTIFFLETSMRDFLLLDKQFNHLFNSFIKAIWSYFLAYPTNSEIVNLNICVTNQLVVMWKLAFRE